MSDLIDRKVASDALRELFKYYVSTGTGKFTFIDAIDTSADVQKVIKQIPTVEATQEETKIAEFLKGYTAGKQDAVVHAHWNMECEEAGAFETTRTYYYARCSRCHRVVQVNTEPGLYNDEDMKFAMKLADKDLPYCNCGAKMDEEVQDDG